MSKRFIRGNTSNSSMVNGVEKSLASLDRICNTSLERTSKTDNGIVSGNSNQMRRFVSQSKIFIVIHAMETGVDTNPSIGPIGFKQCE